MNQFKSAKRQGTRSNLAFELLLAEISTQFINLPADKIESEIEKAQRRICECLGFERSVLWQFSDLDPGVVRLTHIYQIPESPHPIVLPADASQLSNSEWAIQTTRSPGAFMHMQGEAYFPWLAEQVRQGRTILISRLDDLPEEASQDREILSRYGTQSTAVIPLMVAGVPLAGMSFAMIREECAWPEALVNRLHLVGQVFANAISRRYSDLAVRESEERLRLASESAGMGLWSLDILSGLAWATPPARKMLGIGEKEPITLEIILDRVHPEDQARFRSALAQASTAETEIHIEYRIIHPVHGIRWLSSSGRPHFRSSKEPERLMGVSHDITERKSVEIAVRKSEEKFFKAFESSPMAMSIVSLDERKYIEINRAYELRTGYARKEVISRTVMEVALWLDADELNRAFAMLSSEGRFRELEMQYRTKGGNLRIGLLSADVIEFAGERCTLTVAEDITDRREMEKQLQSAAGQWQATFDAVEDSIMILDPQLRIQQVNAATISFLGMPADKILGRRCHEIFHGTEGVAPGCPAAALLKTLCHQESEIFHEKKKINLLVSAYPIIDTDGNFKGLVHMLKDITERKRMEQELQTRLHEIEDLKGKLEQENVYLRKEVTLLGAHREIVAVSPSMEQVLDRAEQVARTDSTVLITGETGTGKDLIARAIHNMSSRKDRPLITVNCASLPANLIEAELFGREKGAYTGAMARMAGRFEVADGSTAFLDEIGELPQELQAKILRFLETGSFERLGSSKTIKVDVRIIAATNRDLVQMVEAGKFRKDLYYRLNVFPIFIPPLRERPEDIPPLVWAFVHQLEKRIGKQIQTIPRRNLDALQRYPWPGNARELRNVVEHAMIVSTGKSLQPPSEILATGNYREESERKLEEIERRHILNVLEETGWRVSGTRGAANVLGLKRTTLEARMKKLGIKRPNS
jgi:PAS domain S-box-containing protein